MITFKLSEEQDIIRDTIRGFAEAELSPRAREADESGKIPDGLLDRGWELGIVNSTIPEEYGGAGMERSPVTNAIVLEEFGAGDVVLGSAVMAPAMVAWPILDFGTEEQKRELLPLFAGESYHAASLALHEPSFTFDPANLETCAEKNGKGWTITGEKRLVPMGDEAGHLLVIANGGGDPGLDNLEAFILPRDTKGLTISNEAERTLGFEALPSVRIKLDGVKATSEMRLGGDKGIDGRRLLNMLRVGSAALAVGLARTVTEFAIPYAKERVAFGEPIAKKQAIAFMLADMHTEVEAMRWMVWKAASLLEKGEDATKAATLARSYVSRKAMKVADDGLQIFGGHGFIRDLPLEMWLRNMRTLTVVESAAAV